MTEPRYSAKRARAYTRKFDRDEVRKMRADGMTTLAIAEHFGVTRSAIYYALNREDITTTEPQFVPSAHKCERCGGYRSKDAALCKQCRHEMRLTPPVPVK